MRSGWVLACLLTFEALGASRARYGGTLKVAHSGPLAELAPVLADTPGEATLASLRFGPLCRLDAEGHVLPALARHIEQPDPTTLRIELWEGLVADDGSPVTTRELVTSWNRILQTYTASPYRALLYPAASGGRIQVKRRTPTTLELALAHPFPNLSRALCHPSLAMALPRGNHTQGLGPFAAVSATTFRANPRFPEGRPFVDQVQVEPTEGRGATRLLDMAQADVVLGAEESSGPVSPLLYATYLGFREDRVGADFRQAVEAAVDRIDLTRFFVRPPSAPMRALLPPPLMNQPSPLTPKLKSRAAAREVQLLFDETVPDQKSVAERLQVKLHDRGYRVAPKGVSRRQLRSRWASGDYDLILHAVLLPPAPTPALGVVLELSGKPERLTQHLPSLGAIPESPVRDTRARELATELLGQVELIPLYAQGIHLAASPRVKGLTFDAQGLPLLDSVFLTEP